MTRMLSLLASLALSVAPAAAQDPAPTTDPAFATLEHRLREGDAVTVTADGLGNVRGHLVGLAPDSLTVATDVGPQRIAADRIDRIKRRRVGVVLGTILGAGVGVALAIPLNMLIANEGGNATGDTIGLLALTTGIGLGIDAAINIPRAVYRRANQPRVQLAPHVGPKIAGLGMRVTF